MKEFIKDESGATAIEYGLIAALIGVVLIASLGALGEALDGIFNQITAALQGSGPPAPDPGSP